jgi:ATP-binding cassette subfamily B (MDR/TAP) protein 1
MEVDAWTIHARACERGELSYVDPESGLIVLTELGLEARGACCGCGCRHCPYHHENVPANQRLGRIQRPATLHGCIEDDVSYDVLFWSGGKDSLLARRALAREHPSRPVLLLTTFNAETREIAHQEIPLDQIVRQADALELPLLGVPLQPGRTYLEQIEEGLQLVPRPARLVFGDLHLAEIRTWREQELGPLAERRGACLHFPLWHADYEALLDDLEASGVPCIVSAVLDSSSTGISVGQRFDRTLTLGLPAGVDAFGETGDFHTLARVWDAPEFSPSNR